MRQCLNELVSRKRYPDHLGLAYDVWAPVNLADGKIPDDLRTDWLKELSRISISPDYQTGCYERWLNSLAADGSRATEMQLASRLLVGHGNPSATEVGLTVHRTWGVPVIPGSALKGLLAHYLEATYGLIPDPDKPSNPITANYDPAKPQREDFQGVTWQGPRITYGPGRMYRVLFGSPNAEHDRDFPDVSGTSQGGVIFHDALYVPGSATDDRPFAQDVLTVHQFTYYQKEGKDDHLPNDYDDPNPVGFLSVRPGSKFLIALSGPMKWTDFALTHLKVALEEWGVGGKSTAGYGRADPNGWKDRTDPRAC